MAPPNRGSLISTHIHGTHVPGGGAVHSIKSGHFEPSARCPLVPKADTAALTEPVLLRLTATLSGEEWFERTAQKKNRGAALFRIGLYPVAPLDPRRLSWAAVDREIAPDTSVPVPPRPSPKRLSPHHIDPGQTVPLTADTRATNPIFPPSSRGSISRRRCLTTSAPDRPSALQALEIGDGNPVLDTQ